MIRALIDARRATSAPHVPRRCPVCWPPDVLERVFPADQLDPELLERPVFARPTDQTIRGAHVHRQTPQRETST